MKKFAANTTADMLGTASLAFNEEPDPQFAKDAMPANLKMMEGILKVSPDNPEVLYTLAQGYCSYAFAFLEDSDQPGDLDRARAFYLRGYHYGLRSLPEKLQSLANGNLQEFEKEVFNLSKSDSPNLFWTAYCLGSWVNVSKTEVSAVADLSRVEIMMRKMMDIEPGFYNGGPYLFYGVYYGARPKMLGGNLNKAKENLEKAIALTQGKFLMAKLYLAQFYAVFAQDEKLFDSSLKDVLDASSDLYPAERLANQIAKKRAYKLLNQKKNLF